MPSQPDPYVAFLSSIQDAFAANPTPNAFTPGAQGVPGAQGMAGDANGGTVGGVVGGGIGAGGASVPGTATTGQNVLQDIVSGDTAPGSVVGTNFLSRFGGPSDPSGFSQGEFSGLQGGDVGTLLTVLGGPLAPATMLASLVASDALGMDLDPNLLSTTSLVELVGGGRETLADNFDRSRALGAEIGGPVGGELTVGTRPGGGTVNRIRGGVGRQESEIDRGRDPGPGPNRGAAGAGNRGR